jgi:HK97 family phage prohead protease
MTFIERAVDFEPLPEEERAGNQGDGKTLEGYAAVFDADTEINSWEGHFKERIVRGAFRKTLRERTPVLQFDHGHDSRFGNLPIGRFESIKEDKHGLRVQARLFDHADPIREAIAEGAVSGMSFRFKVVRDSWADKDGNEIKDRGELLDLLYGGDKKRGPLQRTIKEVKLMEAGPVVFPAYPQTTVGVRSMNDDERRRAIEEIAFEGASEEERESLADALMEAGLDADQIEAVIEGLRGENPFAKKEGEKPKPGAKHDAAKCDKCTVDKKTGKCTKCGATPKTSGGKGDGPAKPEKKSEDDTSAAPEEGADAAEPREENPDDAAQAGTSTGETGLTSSARERRLRLLEIA